VASLPFEALASPAVLTVSSLEMVGWTQTAFVEGAEDRCCRGDASVFVGSMVFMASIRSVCIAKDFNYFGNIVILPRTHVF
jgi:hypothetical protein